MLLCFISVLSTRAVILGRIDSNPSSAAPALVSDQHGLQSHVEDLRSMPGLLQSQAHGFQYFGAVQFHISLWVVMGELEI